MDGVEGFDPYPASRVVFLVPHVQIAADIPAFSGNNEDPIMLPVPQ